MKKINRSKEMNDAAITLIALVITIIILLILAGVTIGFAVNGTGLFDKAKLATDKYNNSINEENSELDKLEQKIDINSRENVTIDSEIYNKLKNSISLDGSVFINRPDTWNVGTEYAWRDNDRTIYGQRFTGTTTSNTNIGTLTGAKLIIDYNIQVYKEDAQGPVSSGFWSTTNFVSGIYYASITDNGLYFAVSNNYTNLKYEIWILYVK